MHLITKSMKFDEFALNLCDIVDEVFVAWLPLNLRAKLILRLKYATAPSTVVETGEKHRGISNISQRKASFLRYTTRGGTKTDEAEWERAMCDTAVLSPPCTSHMHLTTLFHEPHRKSAAMSHTLQNNIMNN